MRLSIGLSFLVAITASGCVSLSASGQQVRITSNPEVVRECEFKGNVKATSGWGGSAGTGLGTSNTEKTMQNQAAELGGNVLFVVSSGVHASGEAYACK